LSDSNNSSTLLAEAFGVILKPIIEQAVKEAINGHTYEDRLIDAEEAAKILSVSVEWLYRNAKRLPFTRKLGHKMLRFSRVGIQKYLAIRKSS
jgi:predicted DNA-binding transcriptional regulator AlpA